MRTTALYLGIAEIPDTLPFWFELFSTIFTNEARVHKGQLNAGRIYLSLVGQFDSIEKF
jgi:hypothetical protein